MNPEAHRFCFFRKRPWFRSRKRRVERKSRFWRFSWNRVLEQGFLQISKISKILRLLGGITFNEKIPWESRESKRCCIVSYNFECHQPSTSSIKTLFQIWKLCSKSRWCFILRLHEIQPLKTDVLL